MQFVVKPISSKTYEGNVVLLYGNDVADRSLPLAKKELDYLKAQRKEDSNAVVVFDRLPYHLYVVNFDSECPAGECQEKLRRSAGKVVAMLKDNRQREVAVAGEGVIPEEVVAFVEGLYLSDYTFDRYKTSLMPHVDRVVIEESFLGADELERNVKLWRVIGQCREWVNTPVSDLNAVRFANEIKDVSELWDISCTVYDREQLEALRMGGLLAVNRGSVDEPRFVVLEYAPGDAVNDRPLALVGKGIMYDTGGLNIKPQDYMQQMKSDMAGAATMTSVLFAAAANRLPVHVMAFLPLTDSRPGFNAYAADDVLRMYDGTTVEVVNTDAEGRIVLADAIAFAVDKYKPELIIDAATLTGSAVRAIGSYGIAAMQQNADNPFNLLGVVGRQVYERVVEFPFWSEYDELIKSDVAELKNCGDAEAGAITAGRFLAHFAKDTPFIHLDIAGVAFFSKSHFYYNPGASGYGIRLLYAFLQTYDLLKVKGNRKKQPAERVEKHKLNSNKKH